MNARVVTAVIYSTNKINSIKLRDTIAKLAKGTSYMLQLVYTITFGSQYSGIRYA